MRGESGPGQKMDVHRVGQGQHDKCVTIDVQLTYSQCRDTLCTYIHTYLSTQVGMSFVVPCIAVWIKRSSHRPCCAQVQSGEYLLE